MTERRTFLVTVEIDQGVPMPARAVRHGVEARIVGDGFTGAVSVDPVQLGAWACVRCGYHNDGLICTHCGRALMRNGSNPTSEDGR